MVSLGLKTLSILLFLSFSALCLSAQSVTINAITGDQSTGHQVIYTPTTNWEDVELPRAVVVGSTFDTVLPEGEFPSLTLLFDGA